MVWFKKIRMKYTELLKINAELKIKVLNNPVYEVTILSNSIVNQIKPYLEYILRNEGINVNVHLGNYDNIVQDASLVQNKHLVIIFWDLCNLSDGFHYKCDLYSEEMLNQIIQKTKEEIDLVFASLVNVPKVIMNRFSTIPFNHSLAKSNAFDLAKEQLNSYLDQKRDNIYYVDIDKVFSIVSVSKAFDFRNYYSSKALYTIEFYDAYTRFIAPVINSVNGKVKKALILDCDNTLWHGIIGEDGMMNIKMSSKDPKGAPYEEVQSIVKVLAEKGIIVCLNSKNNIDDVNEVLEKHSDMILKDENIVLKMVNWDDKVSNLKEIAAKLNIGLESLVFVDDSDFEIELVKKYLPQVQVVKVPENRYMYPEFFRNATNSFFSTSSTLEDSRRIESYKLNLKRSEARTKHASIEDYLASLELKMKIFFDDQKCAERMAQLSQKTNQFNLTTKRYTVSEIVNFITSNKWKTYVFEVSDKFGDFGITGMSLVEINDDKACIDTFLMSCRVIGRNLEFAFIENIISDLKKAGIKNVIANYYKTFKNAQVMTFYDEVGFNCLSSISDHKNYTINLDSVSFKNYSYIKIDYERKN